MTETHWNNTKKVRSITKRYRDDSFTPEQRRLKLAINYLKKTSITITTLMDCGCGTGSNIEHLCHQLSLKKLYGADSADLMLSEASCIAAKVKDKVKTDISILKWDISKPFSFQLEHKVDCITLFSVLPYIEDAGTFFKQLPTLLRDKGFLIASYPNKLFDLFTLNSFTGDFICDELIGSSVDKNVVGKVKETIHTRLFDSPHFNQQSAYSGNVDFHRENPLTIADTLRPYGLVVDKVYFMHYHCMPPYFKGIIGEDSYNALNEDKEKDIGFQHWTQYFTNSTFMVCCVFDSSLISHGMD